MAIGNGVMNLKKKAFASTLQYAHMKTVSKVKCFPFLPIMALNKGIICSEGEEKQSICKGDTGGALIDTKNQTLVGISSSVSKFGCGSAPQAFTHVPEFIQWIETTADVTCKK